MAKMSVSKMNTLLRCKRKFYYQYLRELSVRVKSATPSRGVLGHEALEAYNQGKSWHEAINDFEIDMSAVFEEEVHEWDTMKADMYKILRGYFRQFKSLYNNEKTLKAETDFEMVIPSPGHAGVEHVFRGRIDRIFEDNQGIWIQDYKFSKNIPDPSELYLDSQLISYLMVAKRMPGIENAIGVCFDYIRTKVPSEPAVLKNGTLSKAKCDTDYYTMMESIKKHGLNPDDYVDQLSDAKTRAFSKRFKIPVSNHTLKVIENQVVGCLDTIEALQRVYAKDPDRSESTSHRTLIKNNCQWSCPYYKLCMAELAGHNTSGLMLEMYEEKLKEDEEDGNEEG